MSIKRLFKNLIFYWALSIMAFLLITISIVNNNTHKWNAAFSKVQAQQTNKIVERFIEQDWSSAGNEVDNLNALLQLNAVTGIYLGDDERTRVVMEKSGVLQSAGAFYTDLALEIPKGAGGERLLIKYRVSDKNPHVFIFSIIMSSILVAGVIVLAMSLWMRLLFNKWFISEAFGKVLTKTEWNAEEPLSQLRDDTLYSQLFVALFKKYQRSEAERFIQADKIRNQSFVDKVSGLSNRHYFDAQLKVIVSEPERQAYGAVFLLRIDMSLLFARGNFEDSEKQLCRELAERLECFFEGNYQGCISRRTQTDFAMLFEFITPRQVTTAVDKLGAVLANVSLPAPMKQQDYYSLGVSYFYPGIDAYTVLSEADMALRTAQLQGANSWYMHEKSSLEKKDIMGSVRWRALLESVLETRKVTLTFQPAFWLKDNSIMFYEVLTRIKYQHELISGARFFPMAHALGLARQLDRVIIDHVFKCFSCPQDMPAKLALNLYSESLLDDSLYAWLMGRLVESPKLSEKLIFEISEAAMGKYEQELVGRLRSLQELGCEVAIDNVGQPLVSTHYLRDLKVKYLKLDTLVVRDVDKHSEKQFFVRAVAEICGDLGVALLAEGIEQERELHFLEEVPITGAQGYLLSRPVNAIMTLETIAS